MKLFLLLFVGMFLLNADVAVAEGSSVNPISCEVAIENLLEQTDLTDHQIQAHAAYLNNADKIHKLGLLSRFSNWLRGDGEAAHHNKSLRVFKRVLKNKKTNEEKVQTVTLISQPGAPSKEQVQNSRNLVDNYDHVAVATESWEGKKERYRNLRLKKLLWYLVRDGHRALRVGLIRLTSFKKERPLQHQLKSEDKNNELTYLEDGYTPLKEEDYDLIGGDIRAATVFYTLLYTGFEFSKFFLGGGDLMGAGSSALFQFTNWLGITEYISPFVYGLYSSINGDYQWYGAIFFAGNLAASATMNKLKYFPESGRGKKIRAFLGWEAQNDSSMFRRKTFYAEAISRMAMTLWNKDRQAFDATVVVVDERKLGPLAKALVDGNIIGDREKEKDIIRDWGSEGLELFRGELPINPPEPKKLEGESEESFRKRAAATPNYEAEWYILSPYQEVDLFRSAQGPEDSSPVEVLNDLPPTESNEPTEITIPFVNDNPSGGSN